MNLDKVYRDSRAAMLHCLRSGVVDPDELLLVQKGMAAIEPHKRTFGEDRYGELRRLLNQIEQLPRRREPSRALVPVVQTARYAVPALYSAPPAAPQLWQNKLSLDQMIGIFCLCGLFVWSGFNLTLMAYIGGIFAIVYAWRWLHRRAPVTAEIIVIIFGILVLGLLSAGRGGRYRRRRW